MKEDYVRNQVKRIVDEELKDPGFIDMGIRAMLCLVACRAYYEGLSHGQKIMLEKVKEELNPELP